MNSENKRLLTWGAAVMAVTLAATGIARLNRSLPSNPIAVSVMPAEKPPLRLLDATVVTNTTIFGELDLLYRQGNRLRAETLAEADGFNYRSAPSEGIIVNDLIEARLVSRQEGSSQMAVARTPGGLIFVDFTTGNKRLLEGDFGELFALEMLEKDQITVRYHEAQLAEAEESPRTRACLASMPRNSKQLITQSCDKWITSANQRPPAASGDVLTQNFRISTPNTCKIMLEARTDILNFKQLPHGEQTYCRDGDIAFQDAIPTNEEQGLAPTLPDRAPEFRLEDGMEICHEGLPNCFLVVSGIMLAGPRTEPSRVIFEMSLNAEGNAVTSLGYSKISGFDQRDQFELLAPNIKFARLARASARNQTGDTPGSQLVEKDSDWPTRTISALGIGSDGSLRLLEYYWNFKTRSLGEDFNSKNMPTQSANILLNVPDCDVPGPGDVKSPVSSMPFGKDVPLVACGFGYGLVAGSAAPDSLLLQATTQPSFEATLRRPQSKSFLAKPEPGAKDQVVGAESDEDTARADVVSADAHPEHSLRLSGTGSYPWSGTASGDDDSPPHGYENYSIDDATWGGLPSLPAPHTWSVGSFDIATTTSKVPVWATHRLQGEDGSPERAITFGAPLAESGRMLTACGSASRLALVRERPGRPGYIVDQLDNGGLTWSSTIGSADVSNDLVPLACVVLDSQSVLLLLGPAFGLPTRLTGRVIENQGSTSGSSADAISETLEGCEQVDAVVQSDEFAAIALTPMCGSERRRVLRIRNGDGSRKLLSQSDRFEVEFGSDGPLTLSIGRESQGWITLSNDSAIVALDMR